MEWEARVRKEREKTERGGEDIMIQVNITLGVLSVSQVKSGTV